MKMATWVSQKDEASSQCCQHGWDTPEELVSSLGSPCPVQGNGGNDHSDEADSEGGWGRVRPQRVPSDAHSNPQGGLLSCRRIREQEFTPNPKDIFRSQLWASPF